MLHHPSFTPNRTDWCVPFSPIDTGPWQLRAAVGAHYLTTGTKLTHQSRGNRARGGDRDEV